MDENPEDAENLFERIENLRRKRNEGGMDPERFRQMLVELNRSLFNPRDTDGGTTTWNIPTDFDLTGGGQYEKDHPGWSGRSHPESSDQGADGAYVREFDWRYRRHTAEWELKVPKRLYRYYSQRARTRSFGTYIADPFDREYIKDLIGRIEDFCTENGTSQNEIADVALRFVQHFEYASDRVTQGELEYPKFPMETLLHEGGDCEDSSISLGAILWELGYDVAIVVLPRKQHMMLGVSLKSDTGGARVEYEGTEYTLVETTNPGWDFGNIPPKYNGASTQVYPVDTQPVLVHQWEAKPTGEGRIEVEGHIANFGTAIAEDIRGHFSLETEDNRTVTGDTVCSVDRLHRSKSTEFTGSVPTPDIDVPARGKVTLTVGNSLHDASTGHFR